MNKTTVTRLAAVFGFAAVALGAFGAHALRNILSKNGMAHTWETAVLYHALHATGLLVMSQWQPIPKGVVRCFTVGILVFSGSLYLLALTGLKMFGVITPFGGVAFLLGWMLLGLRRME